MFKASCGSLSTRKPTSSSTLRASMPRFAGSLRMSFHKFTSEWVTVYCAFLLFILIIWLSRWLALYISFYTGYYCKKQSFQYFGLFYFGFSCVHIQFGCYCLCPLSLNENANHIPHDEETLVSTFNSLNYSRVSNTLLNTKGYSLHTPPPQAMAPVVCHARRCGWALLLSPNGTLQSRRCCCRQPLAQGPGKAS